MYEHVEGCLSKGEAWRLWHCDTCSFVISAEWCSNNCHWGARSCVRDSAVEQRVMSMGKHSGRKCKVPEGTALLVLHIDDTLVVGQQLESLPKFYNEYSNISRGKFLWFHNLKVSDMLILTWPYSSNMVHEITHCIWLAQRWERLGLG